MEKKSKFYNLKSFSKYYKPYIGIVIFDLLCACLTTVCELVLPMIVRHITGAAETGTTLLISAVLKMGALYLFLRVVDTCANYYMSNNGHIMGARIETDMRRDVFTHLENQSFTFYDKHRTGKLMSRATTDLFEITELAHHGPEDFIISILTLLGSFFLLLKIRWELAIVVFIFLPIIIAIIMISRRSLSESSRKVKDATAEINAVLESSISGVRVTKVFTNEEYELNRFEEGNKLFKSAKKKFYKHMSSFHANIEFFSSLLSILVLAVGGFFIMQDKMSISDLVAANLFIAAFSSPIRRISFLV